MEIINKYRIFFVVFVLSIIVFTVWYALRPARTPPFCPDNFDVQRECYINNEGKHLWPRPSGKNTCAPGSECGSGR